MKIGIGCTTYNRPEYLQLWIAQIKKHIAVSCDIYIANDSDGKGKLTVYDTQTNTSTFISSEDKTYHRQGVASRKNECLRHLIDCDYIFLFDDDTFPIKDGWVEFFIEASKASGQQHMMYLRETPMLKKISIHPILDVLPKYNILSIDEYDNCAGCMMFFTKEVIEKVGAYDPRFGTYGFEHAQYTNRIHKAGLTPLGAYTCPAGAGEYIYAMDLDNHLPFNKELNHKSSIEIKEALQSIERNKDIYLQDTEIYIPL